MDTQQEILFDLIKFDMQQIHGYREAILKISIISTGASFAISAFLYGRDGAHCTLNENSKIILSTHFGLVAILVIVGYFYNSGLNGSRDALEMREAALKENIETGKKLTASSLYPDTTNYQRTHNSLSIRLEKIPLLLTLLVIIIKMMIESSLTVTF